LHAGWAKERSAQHPERHDLDSYECLPKIVSSVTLGFRRVCASIPATETYAQTKPIYPHQGMEFTFHTTLQVLFEKTGVRTRGQLVRIALERSLENALK
jgi:hypothetical protein